jgi:D-methionine transport system permease protein
MIAFFDNLDWVMVWEATGSTIYMTAVAGLSTFVLGLIIGLLLFATNE